MLDVRVCEHPEYLELRLQGELDSHSTSEARKSWRALLERRPILLLVDISSLAFLDGWGARFLLECYRDAVAGYSAIAIVTSGNPSVHSVLEYLCWEQILPLYATHGEALAALEFGSQWLETFEDYKSRQMDCVLWTTNGETAHLTTGALPRLNDLTVPLRSSEPHLLHAVVHPKDRERVRTELCSSLDFGRLRTVDYRVLSRSGNTCWLRDQMMREATRQGNGKLRVVTLDVGAEKAGIASLQRREAHFRRLFELAPQGLWELDGDGICHSANPRLAELLGRPLDTLIGSALWDMVSPQERRRIDSYLAGLWEGRMEEFDLRVVRSDGSDAWVLVSARPVRGPNGAVTEVCGVVTDITPLQTLLRQTLERQQQMESLILHHADGIFTIDATGRFIDINRAAELISGYARNELVGKPYMQLLTPDAAEDSVIRFQRALEGQPQSNETAIYHRSGHRVDLDLTAVPIKVGERIIGVFGVAHDISDRKRSERERENLLAQTNAANSDAERARERLCMLIETGRILASSFNYQQVVDQAVRRTIPLLGDYCTVDTVDDSGAIHRLAGVHVDPVREDLVRQLSLSPADPTQALGVPEVIRTGVPAVYAHVSDILNALYLPDAEVLPLLHGLQLHSLMCVPMVSRGRVMGAISFARTTPGTTYGREDIEIAEELARNIALCIDNARLFGVYHEIARTLQESLLPAALPKIAGMEVAATYRAAGEANLVGGDFYDLFPTQDNSWTVLIGDVTGKGPAAAAITSLVRHTVRAVASRARWPQRVLSLVNKAVLEQTSCEQFCSAACGRLTRSNGSFRLRIASAGHPPALILRRNGRVETLEQPGMLLGVLPELTLKERTAELRAGDALILYTDGITEARHQKDLFGEDRLQSVVRDYTGRSAAEIVQMLDRSVMAFQHNHAADDLAIVVLRVPLDKDPADEPPSWPQAYC